MLEQRPSDQFTLQSSSLAICIAVGVPVLLWGSPGIGKTSIIQEIATSYGLHLETVIASIREPSDFSGLPYFDKGVMHLASPAWAHNIIEQNKKGTPSLVFYDEISTAPPATQAALLRPILEGVVGETVLPTNARTVAAANPPRVASNGWDLTPPAANRFVHLDWDMDAQTMKNGFQNGWPTVQIPQFPNSFSRMVKNSKIIVGQFIGSNPGLVSLPPEGKARKKETFTASDNAYPTPRSWEMVAKLYAAAKVARFPDGSEVSNGVLTSLIQGTVGIGAATEFLKFAKNIDLPEPKKMLADPSVYKDFNHMDKLNVMLSAVQSYVLSYQQHNAYPQLWKQWGNVLTYVYNNDRADIAFSYTKEWHRARPEGSIIDASQMKAFGAILKELDKN